MAGLVYFRIVTVSLLLTLFLCVDSQVTGDLMEGQDVIVGGEREVPGDDPEVLQLAKIVTDKLSEGDRRDRKVVQVLNATRQVVAGTLTHLKLKISDGDVERVYTASIWEQPWLNKTQITKLELVDGDNA